MILPWLCLFVHRLHSHPVSEPPIRNAAAPEARPVDAFATATGVKATIISPFTSSTTPHAHEALELRKRTSLDTCGYINGEPLTCPQSNALCSTNTIENVVGCCDPLSSCVFPTTCIPSSLLSLCTGNCITDISVTRCTNSLFPYCTELIFPGNGINVSNVGCFSVANITVTVYSTLSTPITTTPPIVQSTISESFSLTTTIGTTSVATPPKGSEFPTDFGAGGIAGCTVGGCFILGLFICWKWGNISNCMKRLKRATVPPQGGEKATTSLPTGDENGAVSS